jgi:hypothetical protein
LPATCQASKGETPWLEVQHHFVAAQCASNLIHAPHSHTHEVDCSSDNRVASNGRLEPAKTYGKHRRLSEQ